MNLANFITLIRIFLVPAFVYTLLSNNKSDTPIIIYSVCILTDAIDGFIARYFKSKSQLGIFLDPFADKVLILSSYYVLTILEKIPMWLFVIILGKEVILISGWILIYILTGSYKITVGLAGKLTVIVQMLTIFLVLLNIPTILQTVLFHITGFAVIFTTLEYCIKGAKQITSPQQ